MGSLDKKHRVLVVYTNKLFYDSIGCVLQQKNDVLVVGAVNCMAAAVEQIRIVAPDTIIVEADETEINEMILRFLTDKYDIRLVCTSLSGNRMGVFSKVWLENAGRNDLLDAVLAENWQVHRVRKPRKSG